MSSETKTEIAEFKADKPGYLRQLRLAAADGMRRLIGKGYIVLRCIEDSETRIAYEVRPPNRSDR